jgi:RHS repeat-associated protein
VSVGLVASAAWAPVSLASSANARRAGIAPTSPPAAPQVVDAPVPSAAGRPAATPARGAPEPQLPQLWLPRSLAARNGAGGAIDAAALFDGDATTGLEAAPGQTREVRVELGGAPAVVALGLAGRGRARIEVDAEDPAGRHPVEGMGGVVTLTPDAWVSLAAARPTSAQALVVAWTPLGPTAAAVTELAPWALGPARDAVADAAASDRLLAGLPAAAVAMPATPESATIARLGADGHAQPATFSVRIDRSPALLGRAFLIYELEAIAHWTGPSRSINGHVLRGGYRAAVRGPAATQVEEIAPAWLHVGDNVISFRPSNTENGLGYRVKRLRIVGLPRQPDGTGGAARAGAGPNPLADGSTETGVGGRGSHTVRLPSTPDAQPAELAFFLDRPSGGSVLLAARRAETRHKAQVRISLEGMARGWHAVSLGAAFPATTSAELTVAGDREGQTRITEARLLSFPPLGAGTDLVISYPLHGECFDHQAYLRGFVRADKLAGAAFGANGEALGGALDGDGSFATVVPEPSGARGKPWTIQLDVAAPDGRSWRRAVSVDTCTEPPRARVAGQAPPVEDAGAPYGGVVSPRQPASLSFGGATLEIPAGAVESDVRVTIRPLAADKLAPMGQLMTNVTPGGGAFRLGPHGLTFKKPIKVTFPVEGARMQPGMDRHDLQAFYYDEGRGKWMSVGARAATRERVTALTGHFTDFIAATLAIPDHPETQQFNPNTIKEIKLADPASGISLISAPRPDPSGAARLRYPIELPEGRDGVQPQLALIYDSERVNINGWMGVGWDLPLSTVEIDTRFGVPRYDGTETYLLDGAMLTPSGAGDGTYVRRVEGRFDHITRVGTGPTDYHWEVVDKTGTKFVYGANLDGANSRLADGRDDHQPGNIFRWMLERVEDPFGNFLTIKYVVDSFTRGDTFVQVYPQEIDYTGAASLAPAYQVLFRLDDGSTRPDVVLSGRSGFPVATRRRLVEIDVRFQGAPVRAYEFEYTASPTDTFNKSLLSAVALRSNAADARTELYRHTFDYFKAPAADAMFAPQAVWGQFQQPDGSPRSDDGLHHANDELFGASGSVGFGFGDLFSATVSGGGDTGSTTPDLVFTDTNGDSLPDQIDRGGNLSLNALAGAPPQGHFSEDAFPGLGTVGHTNRSGWTAGGSISALEGLFGVGGSYSQHTAEDDALLVDMNADGFLDVVTMNAGTVFVGLNDGAHHFGPPQPWGSQILDGVSFSRQDRFGQAGQAGAFFPADPLIRWVAPFPGTVTIDTTLTKVKAGGDGVRADLFVNAETVPRWTCSIAANDLSPCVQTLSLGVAAGDRVYTKVSSLGNPSADELLSSINVAYQVDPGIVGALEPTGAPVYRFNQGDDFRLAGLPALPWTANADGDVQVSACINKVPSADSVVASVIQKSGAVVVNQFDLPLDAGQSGTFCIPQLAAPLQVLSGQTLSFQVTSDAQIDPATVVWPAAVAYTNYCRIAPRTRVEVCAAPVCAAGFCTIGPTDPLSNFPIPQGFVQAAADVFYPAFQWTSAPAAPTASMPAPSSGSVHLVWPVSRSTPERVVVLIQGVNRLLGKAVLDGTTGSATIDVIPTVTSGEPLFFTVFAPDNPFGFVDGTPTIDGNPVAAVNYRFADPNLDNNSGAVRDAMSGGYHRWFYGDWNGSKTFDESAIRVTATPTSADDFLFATPAPFGLATRPDLGPIPMWLGRGSNEFVSQGRIAPGFTASGASTGHGDGVNALRISDTWNVDLHASVVGASVGVNGGDSTTDVDLFDLNGDRYPDSVTSGAISYNDGRTGFSARQGIDMGFDDVRSTENASLRFGIDLSSDNKLINLASSKSKTSRTVATAAISGSTDYGVSSTRVDFIDVNGDGLVDHVKQSPGDDDADLRVRLNLGYGFSKEIAWTNPHWSQSKVAASLLGFNVGFVTDALGLVPGNPPATDTVRLADTQTNSASIGGGGETFGAGGGPTVTLTRKLVDIVDLNGDGLPDEVFKVPGETDGAGNLLFRVKLNMGDQFGPETAWAVPPWLVDTSLPDFDLLGTTDSVGFSTLAGWSASVNFQVCFFVCVGGSAFYSRDNGGSNMDFEDVDGDGKPDQVLKNANDPNVYVKLNQTGKTNLLATVHRPLGGTITLDYERVGNRVDHTAALPVDMPGNQWALASVSENSGQGNVIDQTIDYSHSPDGLPAGFFDRVEREHYGYADVKTAFPGEGSSIARTYANQDFFEKGFLLSATYNQVDATGQALKKETFSYADPSGKDPRDPALRRTGTLFPASRDTTTVWFEADPAGRSKRQVISKTYDATGNLTNVVDTGDADFGDLTDDVNYHFEYVHPDGGGLITRPSVISARTGQDATGTLLRQRSAIYFPTGKPQTVTDVLLGGKDPATGRLRTLAAPDFATWIFAYDAFGNIQQVTDPKGHQLTYGYDAAAQTHRTSTNDLSFGYVSTASYDLRFGLPTQIVDVDGAKQQTDYDDFGRAVAIFGPNDFDATGARTTPALTFSYSEQPHQAPTTSQPFVETLPASATTSHKNVSPPEMSRPRDPIPARPAIRGVAFVDGMGRTIQTKNDITHDDGQGNVVGGMSVSGKVVFDSRGRIFQQGQPTFVPGGATDFVASAPLLNPTTFAYDMLARERQVARPNTSAVDAAAHGNQEVTTTSYQLGALDGRLYLLKLVQDPRGEVRSIFRTVRDEVIGVDEVNKVGGVDNVHLVSRYQYDPISQLVSVTDPAGNVTSASYDSIGKMVALTSPDAGRTEWRFDLAGNTAVKETPNLRARGKVINYIYNFDRLEGIQYPDSAAVQYIYGDSTETGAANSYLAGRIKRRTDESGHVDFQYDALGNVVKETNALVSFLSSQPNGYLEVMTYSYDSFGRMIEMQFPGSTAEIVRYGYDSAGMVTSARGLDTVVTPPTQQADNTYYQHIGYDEFGQRTRVVLGNGIQTHYAYEPETRRLSQINTDFINKSSTLPMQRLRYAYDLIGNVRGLRNDVPIPPNNLHPVIVGPTTYSFDYDRLYQLTHVDGIYQTSATNRFRHSLDYAYDQISNISEKTQQDFRDQAGTNGVFQQGAIIPQTTYTFDYTYAGGAPHAPSQINENLHDSVSVSRNVSQDQDGNQAGWTEGNGQVRAETWSEEDRLREVQDQGLVSGQYLYSADGTRTHSFVDGRELVYVNQYLTIRNNSPYVTKHIYAGNVRMASRLDGQASPPSAFFWYHTDQLESPQFVTTSDQSLVEHTEYFASGEPWKDEGSSFLSTVRPEFMFNGKELDTITGLYYFGSRYYDPVVQNWQSTDPALVKYMRGEPRGGVFAPAHLGLYSYGLNNPLSMRDTSGTFEEPVHGALTYHLAVAAGFSEKDAATIALSTAGVDHNPHTAPVSFYNSVTGVTYYYHFADPKDALDRFTKAAAGKDLQALGIALHTLEDVGFKGTEGPHKRANNQGIGHPYYKTEKGNKSTPFNHVADQAYQDPRANKAELMRIFTELQSAAKLHGGTPTAAGAKDAEAAIDRIIAADKKTLVDSFLNSVPVGAATHTYVEQVEANRKSGGTMSSGVSWSASEIDSSIK